MSITDFNQLVNYVTYAIRNIDKRTRNAEQAFQSQMKFQTLVENKITKLENGIKNSSDELFNDIDTYISKKIEALKVFNKEIIDQAYELMDTLTSEFRTTRLRLDEHIRSNSFKDQNNNPVTLNEFLESLKSDLDNYIINNDGRVSMLKKRIESISKDSFTPQQVNELPFCKSNSFKLSPYKEDSSANKENIKQRPQTPAKDIEISTIKKDDKLNNFSPYNRSSYSYLAKSPTKKINGFKIREVQLKNFNNDLKMSYYRPFYFQNNLYLIGGRDAEGEDELQQKFRVLKFNALSQYENVRMGRSVSFRAGFGICADENNLYLYGGHTRIEGKDYISNELYKMNLSLKSFKMMTCMSYNYAHPRTHFGNILVYNNKLFMVGGIVYKKDVPVSADTGQVEVSFELTRSTEVATVSDEIATYDFKKNSFTTTIALNDFLPRFDHTISLYKKKYALVAFGKNHEYLIYDVNFINLESYENTRIDLSTHTIFHNFSFYHVDESKDGKNFDILCLNHMEQNNESVFYRLLDSDFKKKGQSIKIGDAVLNVVVKHNQSYYIISGIDRLYKVDF